MHPAPAIPHHVNPPVDVDFGYHVGSLLQKSGSLASGTKKVKPVMNILKGSLSTGWNDVSFSLVYLLVQTAYK